jgi:hypothetical protein
MFAARLPLISREAFQAGIVLVVNEDVRHSLDGLFCARVLGGLKRAAGREYATGDQERALDLLVCGHSNRGKALSPSQLVYGQEQASLANAGFTLKREAKHASLGRRQRLLDGGQLGGASHHGASHPSSKEA